MEKKHSIFLNFFYNRDIIEFNRYWPFIKTHMGLKKVLLYVK